VIASRAHGRVEVVFNDAASQRGPGSPANSITDVGKLRNSRGGIAAASRLLL
jgi:hypothetical protein